MKGSTIEPSHTSKVGEQGKKEIEMFLYAMKRGEIGHKGRKKVRKDNTIMAYRKNLTDFYALTGVESVNDVTLEVVDRYQDYLIRRRYRSADRRTHYVKFYLKYWGKKDLADKVMGISIDPKPKPDILTYEEIDMLYDTARNYPQTRYGKEQRLLYSCIISLLYYTGLRRHEACDIRLEDIDLKEGVIKFIGKGSKPAEVLLLPQVIKDIKAYLKVRPNVKYNNLLISINEHRPCNNDHLTRIIKRLCAIAGINKRITAHSLRRSFGTHLAQQGATGPMLKEALRHSKMTDTDVYIHLSRDSQRNTLEQYSKPTLGKVKKRGKSHEDMRQDLLRLLTEGQIDQETFRVAMSAVGSSDRDDKRKNDVWMYG